jgi:hypothetical protein
VLYPRSYEGMKGAHPEYRRAVPTLAVMALWWRRHRDSRHLIPRRR